MNSPGGDGAEIIYALRNNNALANLVQDQLEEAGQNVTKVYQLRWPSDTSKDYYFIHRDTGRTEPLMIEYGFVDSTGDDVNQLKNDWQKLGDAVANALLEYVGKPTTGEYYTVVSGDTLFKIATRFNTTVEALKKINNLTSNNLSIGQKLKIPKEEIIEEGIYVVKSGDSLYNIANKYNTTISELMNLNNLKTTVLNIGQKLKVPVEQNENKTYESYTVKSGDTLWNIAKKYNIPVSDLLALNNLNSNSMLTIGQIIKIPIEQTEKEENGYIDYTVKKGDSLWGIAQKYNVTVNEIMKFNNLSNNILDVGQKLKIPANENKNNQTVYIVKSGDSLWQIANKYNTTVAEIKSKNNLSSNNLSIGQQLII